MVVLEWWLPSIYTRNSVSFAYILTLIHIINHIIEHRFIMVARNDVCMTTFAFLFP